MATGALTALAGGDAYRILALAAAMAGFQSSIGALNDLRDRDDDMLVKRWKPLPAGRVTPALARQVALGGGVGGALLSALAGPATLAVGLCGYGLGVLYDLGLKRTAWGWTAFALALPLVPVYAWLGAGAGLPPQAAVLAVVGPLAGLALACANGLADFEQDLATGAHGIAVRLGRARTLVVMAAADVTLIALCWLTVAGSSGVATALLAGTATLVVGATWSSRDAVRWRWLGWQAQAIGVAGLAVGWLSGAAGVAG